MNCTQKVKFNAYATFLKFSADSAILGLDGQILPSCNIENGSYVLTACPKRIAILDAISLVFLLQEFTLINH